MVLLAHDALTSNLVRVAAEARPKLSHSPDTLYAVFAAEAPQAFLGLVSVREIAANPQRIFADLIVKPQLQVTWEMPLDQVFRHLEQEGREYAAVVDERGDFLGAITRTSLLEALLTENRRLTRDLFTLQEEEHRRICRELHDELGQSLVALRADLERLALVGGEALACQIEAMGQTVEALCQVLRKTMHRLRPELLDQLGLAAALQELLEEYRRRHPQLKFELKLGEGFKEVAGEVALCLYRVVQEALTNVVRHACATQVTVCLNRFPQGACRRYFQSESRAVYLSVCDDGRGIRPQAFRCGFGLRGIRERVEALGGTFSVASRQPNQGTCVMVKLPL